LMDFYPLVQAQCLLTIGHLLFPYLGRSGKRSGRHTGFVMLTSVGEAPGERLCAAIVCFCSVVHRRRRSPRVINSIRDIAALLRLLKGINRCTRSLRPDRRGLHHRGRLPLETVLGAGLRRNVRDICQVPP
jgi:hypothetical protein